MALILEKLYNLLREEILRNVSVKKVKEYCENSELSRLLLNVGQPIYQSLGTLGGWTITLKQDGKMTCLGF